MAKLLITLTTLIAINFLTSTNASKDIGVCYGTEGNNLPPAADVINLYKRNDIGKIRLFDPNPAALQALRGSGIEATVSIVNMDIVEMASDPAKVAQWFAANIEPYLADVEFPYISVGNGAIATVLGKFVCPVMKSLAVLLHDKGLAGIKVTTVVPESVLSVPSPLPSTAQFSDSQLADMKCILQSLQSEGSPLLINVYPYYNFEAALGKIRPEYALFTATGTVVQDGNFSYSNLFDATVDSFFVAMEKQGFGDVDIVVSESGWPSAGSSGFASPTMAGIYNRNLVEHIVSRVGTPRRPGAYIEGFVYTMFNENLKSGVSGQNFGLFYPDMKSVYPVF